MNFHCCKNLKYKRTSVNVKTSKGHRAQRYEGAEGVEVNLQALLRSILEVSKQGCAKGDQAKFPNMQQKVYYDCTKNYVNTYHKITGRAKECLLCIGLVLWNSSILQSHILLIMEP
jgi:hypothetical protein